MRKKELFDIVIFIGIAWIVVLSSIVVVAFIKAEEVDSGPVVDRVTKYEAVLIMFEAYFVEAVTVVFYLFVPIILFVMLWSKVED